MNGGLRTLGIAIAFLALAIPARGETIQITSGGLVWSGSSASVGTVTLDGEGFRFEGNALNGLFMPILECGVPECGAGDTVDLLTRASGLDLPGTATVNGTTYTGIGGLVSPTSLSIEWTGTLTIPTNFSGGLLTAPVGFSGRFSNDGASPSLINLFGAGTASLTFSPYPNAPGAFLLSSARYDLEAADPVPEPTSMVLIGSGLAGLAALRRRRNEEGTR